MNISDLYDGVFSIKHPFSKAVKEASDKGSSEWSESDVDLDVTPDGDFEVSSGSKVHLDYSFNVDWRKWGIKDIELVLSVDPQFNIMVDGHDVDVKIPAASLNISWIPGKQYAPVALYVTVDKSGKVKSADLNISYIEH